MNGVKLRGTLTRQICQVPWPPFLKKTKHLFFIYLFIFRNVLHDMCMFSLAFLLRVNRVFLFLINLLVFFKSYTHICLLFFLLHQARFWFSPIHEDKTRFVYGKCLTSLPVWEDLFGCVLPCGLKGKVASRLVRVFLSAQLFQWLCLDPFSLFFPPELAGFNWRPPVLLSIRLNSVCSPPYGPQCGSTTP